MGSYEGVRSRVFLKMTHCIRSGTNQALNPAKMQRFRRAAKSAPCVHTQGIRRKLPGPPNTSRARARVKNKKTRQTSRKRARRAARQVQRLQTLHCAKSGLRSCRFRKVMIKTSLLCFPLSKTPKTPTCASKKSPLRDGPFSGVSTRFSILSS